MNTKNTKLRFTLSFDSRNLFVGLRWKLLKRPAILPARTLYIYLCLLPTITATVAVDIDEF